MDTVYLLIHYEWDCTFVRGIYAAETDAITARIERRAASPSSPHSELCCAVEKWEVHQATPAP